MTGDQLTTWREGRGLNQGQLAAKLRVHIITVNRWENGAREIPDWLELALDGLIYRGKVPEISNGNKQKKAKKK